MNTIEVGLLILLFSVSTYTMLAKTLSKTIITAPMVFISLGLVMSNFDFFDLEKSEDLLHLLAEIALIIILFLDASQINLRRLRKQNAWPIRMLLIGLPLTIVIGTFVGYLFFPEWPFALLLLMAALMAPTDAALGEAVVRNKTVPKNERQTLAVESGLNDGIALPLVLFLASLVAMGSASHTDQSGWIVFGITQVVVGVLVGLMMGYSSGRMFLLWEKHKLTSNVYEGIGILALTGTSYLSANILGGNGFISAFVAGLVFGNMVKGHCRFIYQFAESEGQMLIWAAFVIIGIGLLPEAIEALTWPVAAYIMVSLFFVRPIAIYISLIGTKAKPITRLFMGWFGPRGLATALFALMISKDILTDHSYSVLVIALNTVWISVLLHGLTAAPGARLYAKRIKVLRRRKFEKKMQKRQAKIQPL